MPETQIKVVIKRPNEFPFTTNIQDSLEGLQGAVGGDVELVRIGPFDLYCNEHGKIKGLVPNIRLPHDVVMGTVLVSKANEDGDMASLSDAEAASAIRMLKQLAILVQTMPNPGGEN